MPHSQFLFNASGNYSYQAAPVELRGKRERKSERQRGNAKRRGREENQEKVGRGGEKEGRSSCPDQNMKNYREEPQGEHGALSS